MHTRFQFENVEMREHLGDLVVDGRVLKNAVWGRELHSAGPVARLCKHGNEPSCSKKAGRRRIYCPAEQLSTSKKMSAAFSCSALAVGERGGGGVRGGGQSKDSQLMQNSYSSAHEPLHAD
jgi:hypothetical protein